MKKERPITLCGVKINSPNHICAFFDSREDEYEKLLPFFSEGLENNEEVITIIESDRQHDHCCRLMTAGISCDDTINSGQLKVLTSEDSYIQGGVFAADHMINLLEGVLSEAQQGFHRHVRACGSMEWALRNLPGTDELMEYEARVNSLIPKYECTLLCVYDINRLSGQALADILATHSHVILNGKLQTNSYYIEPLEFLQSLLRRRRRPLVDA
jgi:hypothetical protein